ncbi:MAG: OmpA family protein [Candidatus Acidiferrum sp.]|jgi:outer membrane protein OmpA-like peptidoglycan-associated protein
MMPNQQKDFRCNVEFLPSLTSDGRPAKMPKGIKGTRAFALPIALFALAATTFCAAAQGQVVRQEQQYPGVTVDRSGTFHVEVVQRTTKAISYLHHSGPTEVDFRGTDLMPRAIGEIRANGKDGRIEIKVRVDKLTPATQFGPEFLTYVLWAVTPQGRPKNLGEVLLNGDSSHMEVTTDLQTFGLIVTAEPYFAVTQPSNVVVMENVVSDRTSGTVEWIDAHYELLQRGDYVSNVEASDLQPYALEGKTPLELYEARNAVRIAKWNNAGNYAPDTLQKAEVSLQNAEDEYAARTGNKAVIQNARDAAQTAEDARLIAIRRIEDEQAANDKAAAQQREADAAAQVSQAQADRAAAEQARQDAEAAKAAADAAAQRAIDEKNAAIAERAATVAQAQQAVSQAEQDKAALREQLRAQLNAILETTETARGLIVNMSDVLFDTGRFTLKPGAKEKLAKISGIVLAHPGLQLQVEGYTDSVGTDDFNQELSEQRAGAVRDYLVSQGVSPDAIVAQGYGKSEPVASNDTAVGRQLNRRVELVVSGALIGSVASQIPGR